MAVVTLNKKQVAELVNGATKEILGESTVVTEDLAGVVDMGIALANANAYKNFVENLLVKIAKTYFVDRKYKGKAPNVYRDNFEYGQIVEKVRTKLDEAVDNQSWEIVDGGSYDDNVYVANDVSVKLFMNNVAFEVRKSITNKQIKNAFTGASELGKFVSMVMTAVDNSLTVKLDRLIMMTINNAIAEVYNNRTSVPTACINLLAGYKAIHSNSTLTASTCLYDKDFLIYAGATIREVQSDIANYSTLFNQTGTPVFTPANLQHLVLLEKFEANMSTFAQSSTFHDEFIKLPFHSTVNSWQGTGTDNSLASKGKIMVKTASGNTVTVTGVIGALFDHDALGVTQDDPSVETHYVKSAQFTNYWFKENTMYFNDLDENFVVFYVAD